MREKIEQIKWLSFRLESERLTLFKCLKKYFEGNYVNTGVSDDWKI